METYAAKCDDDKHCYHTDNVALLSLPPKYKYICCFCGHSILISGYQPVDKCKPK